MVALPRSLCVLVKDRTRLYPAPYHFRIIGKSGMHVTRHDSAHRTWDKLKKWAEQNGAEATLIEDRYAVYYRSGRASPMGNPGLIVEITDPIARVIEGLLKH